MVGKTDADVDVNGMPTTTMSFTPPHSATSTPVLSHTSINLTDSPTSPSSTTSFQTATTAAIPHSQRPTSDKKVLPTSRSRHGQSNNISHLLSKWQSIETAANSTPTTRETMQRPRHSSRFHSSKRLLSQSTPNLGEVNSAHDEGTSDSPGLTSVANTSIEEMDTEHQAHSVVETILSIENTNLIHGTTAHLQTSRRQSMNGSVNVPLPQPSEPESTRVVSSGQSEKKNLKPKSFQTISHSSENDDYKMASLQNLNIVLITSENPVPQSDESSSRALHISSVSSPPSYVVSSRGADSLAAISDLTSSQSAHPNVLSLISKFSQCDRSFDLETTFTSSRIVSSKRRWSSTPRLQGPLSPPHASSSSPSPSRPSLPGEKLSSPTSPSVGHAWTSSSSLLTSSPDERHTVVSSQEEEIKQDGRTVYKTKEEKSFSEPKGDGQPAQQLTNDRGDIKTVNLARGQPQQRQDYHFKQTVSTKSQYERGTVPQQQQQPIYLQQQQQQQLQQPVYQQQQIRHVQQQQMQPGYTVSQQQQTTYKQQTQQPSYGQPQQQQQPSYKQQQQQPSYTLPQQHQQPTYKQQQQQPSYGQPQQQQQPTYKQQQPSYGQPQQQQQPSYKQQQQQPSYGQPQQQQQPTYKPQQQQPSYGQPQQQQQPTYKQQQQQQQSQPQQQQQPTYKQQQQQPSYGQPQQQQQPTYKPQQQQPSYGQPQQQQQPSYKQQQQQPSYGQPQQQQQPTYKQQQQQPSYGQPQQQQPSYKQQQQQPSYVQQQQQQLSHTKQQQQQPSYAQRQQQPSGYQQQQTYQHQQVSYQQQQQRQQQQSTYQQQQQQPSYQPQQPSHPQQQQRQQPITIQHKVSTVQTGRSYDSSKPTAATITTITSTTTSTTDQLAPWEVEPEEGVYENEPEQRPDLARESDSNWVAELPSVGLARNLKEKFITGQVENRAASFKKEITPPGMAGGGVFENQPLYNPDVVHYGEETQSEALPERGTARYMAARFKQMERQGPTSAQTPAQREITPDRTTRVEYVSEPRGYVEKYEPQIQAGVFESQPAELPGVVKAEYLQEDILPERGAARTMTMRFRQMSQERTLDAPRGKREITPDFTTKGEYVSEPKAYVEKYEGRPESGVFESQPVFRGDVVRADEYEDDRLPEQGLARNIAAHFREIGNLRPQPSACRLKEITPPREGYTTGVHESTPQYAAHVVHAADQQEDILPERGMARNIAIHFRKMSSGESTPRSIPVKKEFTPPKDGGGVYENTPAQFIPEYNQQPESGVLESQPISRHDVVRGDEPPPYEVELPERGMARSMVWAWRQKESDSKKITPTGSGKPKEFTPPREEPRVLQYRAPRTPKSPVGPAGFGFSLTDGSIHPSDLPGQYQPLAEATVFESDPVIRDDVIREEDTDWMEGMPRSDTTKKMLAKFRHIQQQAATDPSSSSVGRPPLHGRQEGEDRDSRESTPEKVGRSKSMRVAVQLEKCGACQKTVYAMEKIEIEKNAYHKSCFRCSHCHCILTPKTFAINKNVMFCTNHYKQLFATKGNYDEGFGHDQHKNRWKSDDGAQDSQHNCPETTAQ